MSKKPRFQLKQEKVNVFVPSASGLDPGAEILTRCSLNTGSKLMN